MAGNCLLYQHHNWVILFNLVHIRNLQFLAIFPNLAANLYGFLLKTNSISINTTTNNQGYF